MIILFRPVAYEGNKKKIHTMANIVNAKPKVLDNKTCIQNLSYRKIHLQPFLQNN